MSKTLSQIYSEAVQLRNKYLHITELDSGKTNSKMSMLNLITYVQSVLTHSYNTLLDVFETEIATLITNRINGTPLWYVNMAYKFQYNSDTGTGDELVFDEDTLKIKYKQTDESHRIIVKSAYVDTDDKSGIILKVAKDNSGSDKTTAGVNYMPLTTQEMTAFKSYIDQIKFVGSNILSMSIPGDIITIKNCNIVYDDRYITETQAFNNIQSALVDYVKGFDYNAFIYSQVILDTIMSIDYISSVGTDTEIWVKQYNPTTRKYGDEVQLKNMQRAYSGYVKFIDEDGNSTVTTANFTFSKLSEQ